jgi:hypothetical protein
MYPNGLTTSASDEEVNMSFSPTPDYAGLAEAAAGSEAGWMKGVRVQTVEDLKEALQSARSRVAKEGKGMLIDALISS